MVAGAATALPNHPKGWRLLYSIAAAAGLAAYAPWIITWAADPKHNVLTRDFVGALLLATSTPVITGAIGGRLANAGTPPFGRLLTALVVACACLASIPFGILLIHCTSGDCL